MADKCKECGCLCGRCGGKKEIERDDENHADVHLHVEIENLRQRLLERDSHIVTMETQFLNEADKFPNGELASIKEDMLAWQDKYSRLYEAHKRVQKVNQNLEDKLLRIVDKCETEKSAFTKDIATLSHRLADANYTIHRLTQDNEKYRNDVNLAIQLLQCKPSNFVSQRYDSLPSEVQAKVRTYVAQKRVSNNEGGSTQDVKSITVPISTFPPTAMVYNVTKASNVDKDSDEESDDSKPPVDIVSAAIMAKVLEERERERVFAKHCDTCTCHRSILTNDAETQTSDGNGDDGDPEENRRGNNICYENVNYRNEKSSSESLAPNQHHNHNHNHHHQANNRYSKAIGDRESLEKTESSLKNVNKQFDKSFDVKYVNEKISLSQNVVGSIRKLDNLSSGSMVKSKLRKDDEGAIKMEKTKNGYSPLKLQTTIGEGNPGERFNASMRQANGVGPKKADNNRQNNYSQVTQSVYRLAKTNSEWTKYEKIPCQDMDSIDLKRNSVAERREDVSKTVSDDIQTSRVKRSGGISSQRKSDDVEDRREIVKIERSENALDVINERVWKTVVDGTNRVDKTVLPKPRLTLIEVKPLINTANSSAIEGTNCEEKQRRKELSCSSTRLRQSEDTASPSFSSDSLVISISDPPSTSSEFGNNRITLNKVAVNNINCDNNININNNNNNNEKNNNNNNKHNNNNLISNWQDRTTGPRGCSMRITPGSKNILLDNAGHYQTILYTSCGNGNGKPSTALVHNVGTKSVRSGGSASSNSEDNSPVLPSDNTQLQRVAEWVKASGPLELETGLTKSLDLMDGRKLNDDDNMLSVNSLNDALIKMKENKNHNQQQQQQQQNKILKNEDKILAQLNIDGKFRAEETTTIIDKSFYRDDDEKIIDDDIVDNCDKNEEKIYLSINCENDETVKDSENGDLISFESSNDEVDDNQLLSSSTNLSRRLSNDRYSRERFSIDEETKNITDVKITKEMEETYLKLAASLDPENLELSNAESPDITIEKYRKKYKPNYGQRKKIDKTSGS